MRTVNKPWVLVWEDGQPCRFKKRWRVSRTWDINKAMWFRDDDEFKAFILSRVAENDFEMTYQLSKLKIVRKRWWRTWLWSKFDRYHSATESFLTKLDLGIFDFIQKHMTR